MRETEWEAAQSVWIWCDHSPSMRFGSAADWPDKRRRAEVLAMALALLLIRGGEQVALLGSGLPPGNGRAVAMRIAEMLTREDDVTRSLPVIEPLPRYARLVVFSDMLQPIPEIESCVREFAAMGVNGHILQIIDPAEETLPYRGRVRFEGLEGEGGILIGRVESIREEYVTAMRRHREGLGRSGPFGRLDLRLALERRRAADRVAGAPCRARRTAALSDADPGRAGLRLAVDPAGRIGPAGDLVGAAGHPAGARAVEFPPGPPAARAALARGATRPARRCG